MVLEILFQRDAASHDSCELGIIHEVAAGISGEVLLYHFFRNPADTSGQASMSGTLSEEITNMAAIF